MVIALVYDRWGNHYCFPKGLFNQKSAGVGTQSLILQVRAPENGMKQSKPPLSGRGARRVSQGRHDRQAGADRSWAPSARQTLSSLTHAPAHARLQPGGQ